MAGQSGYQAYYYGNNSGKFRYSPASECCRTAKSAVAAATATTPGAAATAGAGGTGGAGGHRSVTVNIDRLVERLEIHTTTLQQGTAQVRRMIEDALLQAVNDVTLAL